MTTLAPRMEFIRASATSGTTAKAKALRAAGHHVIDFAAGELDVGSPPSAVAAAVAAATDELLHHYGPPAGLADLRRVVADQLDLEPDNVLITCGTKHAVFHAIFALIGPGDEVLLPAPYWTSYPSMIHLAGGQPVEVFAGLDRGFKVDVDLLDRAVTERTKLLVFVSPGNPTGAVYTPEEAQAIGEWAVTRGITVLSDEIYHGLVFAPHQCVPVTDLVPTLTRSCLRAGGVGKTFAMTGWRVGWLAGPADLISAAAAVQSHTTSHASNIAQSAALAVIRHGESEWLAKVQGALERRRRVMLDHLHAIPGITCAEPAGAFYVFPSVQAHLGREIAHRRVTSSLDLAEVLLGEAKVAVVPGEAFGAPGHLRLSYALDDADLEDGLARIGQTLEMVGHLDAVAPVAPGRL